MKSDYNLYREIYLIFHNAADYPFSQLIKNGFKHVFAIERQALGWACIDPSRSDLSTTILPASWEVDIIPEFKKRNPSSTIIKLLIEPNEFFNYPRPALLSCVSTMQYLLGVYWPHILTPYMLYKKIKYKPPSNIRVIRIWQGIESLHDKPEKPHFSPIS